MGMKNLLKEPMGAQIPGSFNKATDSRRGSPKGISGALHCGRSSNQSSRLLYDKSAS